MSARGTAVFIGSVLLALLVGAALAGPVGYMAGSSDAFTRARYQACIDFAEGWLPLQSDEQIALKASCEKEMADG